MPDRAEIQNTIEAARVALEFAAFAAKEGRIEPLRVNLQDAIDCCIEAQEATVECPAGAIEV